MSNHLEDLVTEWLEFNGYFARKSVLVGKRTNGGFDGELDVVGFHPSTEHLIHIECSLDTDAWPKREQRFTAKFERGRKHISSIFSGLSLNQEPDQVALLQYGGGGRHSLGGGRIIWVSDLISDIMLVLKASSPANAAVPSTFPLLRTLQLATHAPASRRGFHSLLER